MQLKARCKDTNTTKAYVLLTALLCFASAPHPALAQSANDGLQTYQGANTTTATIAAARKTAAGGDLSTKSDSELTQLTAQWSHLSPSERRNLLAEVRGRMAANRQVRRPIDVRVQRRYGRIVRKSDGSVVVQTRVVEMRPNAPSSNRSAPVASSGESAGATSATSNPQTASTPRRRVTFGFGFEQRIKSRNEQHASETALRGTKTPPADNAP